MLSTELRRGLGRRDHDDEEEEEEDKRCSISASNNVYEDEQVASFHEAEECIRRLLVYNRAHRLPTDITWKLENYAHRLRKVKMERRTIEPSIERWFPRVDKQHG